MKDKADFTLPVIIIGAGPAGLLLSRLLQLDGIQCINLERQSQAHVEGRIRAGVLEEGTVNKLKEAACADRLLTEGQYHSGFDILFGNTRHRIDLKELTGSRVMVYGQTEVTKDLMSAVLDGGGEIVFEAENVEIIENTDNGCKVSYMKDGEIFEIKSRFVAGCDGFWGPSRTSIPQGNLTSYEKVFPFGWLGILSETKPVSHELIYANHEDGFALASMRSEQLSRYYVQVSTDDEVQNWSDERFWETLKTRLGKDCASQLETGPSIEKSIAKLRSFVCEPMQYKSLFLAGDAAHIVPPTGAKGLNLAVGDIHYLHRGLVSYFKKNDENLLNSYSQTALKRVWKAVRFSWWFTQLTHQFDATDINAQRLQQAEFDYFLTSESASKVIAENYIGLPY